MTTFILGIGIVYLLVFGPLLLWLYWDKLVLVLLWPSIKLLGKMVPSTSVRVHTQDGGWGVGWEADGRKFFIYHDYMGWHNLSEGHRRDQCDDPAYCPWHGSL